MTNCKAEKEGNKNMSKVKDENYIHIPGWAVTRLGLKGNELLVYSIIYGFSQDGETRFTGSLQYLSDWTNSTKQSCIKCLECRSKLVGVSHPKGGKRYYYYRCNNAHSVHTCNHKKHYAELSTEKYLLSNLDNLLKDHIATISSVTSETKNTAEKELKELRKELDNLNYIFIKKRMPVSTYERLYAETEDKIKRLESFKPKSTDHLKQFLNSGWRSIYENLTRENKRTFWRNVLDSVHVSLDGIEVFFK